jgi:uncharacterized protein (TIGR01777 family)
MTSVLISGTSGLIGSALAASLESRGSEVARLVRGSPRDSHQLQWNPMLAIPRELVSGFDAVIHLSGENIAGRWTASKKKLIRDSRVVSTNNLSQALANTQKPPKAFICASAIGHYGNRGEEILNEDAPSGDGFLSEVCREWELATKPAADVGIRTLNLRIGVVLARNGGALKQLLVPFRLGLGGKIGDGRQWWSWIHIDDLVSTVNHFVQAAASTTNVENRASWPSHLSGPVNMVSPNPVICADFTNTLARLLHRPAMLTVPAFAARLAFGEMADEGLLASARVSPRKLIESGFEFHFPDLTAALRDLLR